jgi:hypothetical protein
LLRCWILRSGFGSGSVFYPQKRGSLSAAGSNTPVRMTLHVQKM